MDRPASKMPQYTATNEAVVLVHGLWMRGVVLTWLARRLRRCGFQVHIFSYPSTRRLMAENVRHLARFITSVDGAKVHFVGHSLGGRIILGLFSQFPEQRPGRIVLLCTPLAPSLTALSISRFRGGCYILGRSVGELTTGADMIDGRDVGVIAGSRSIGLGRLVCRLPTPNDGAVSVAETFVPSVTDHLILRVSHSSVLISAQAARQVCHFLTTGRFYRDKPPAVF